MSRARSKPGFGVLPALAALAFVLPVVWYYGPQLTRPQTEILPGQETEWYKFVSTDGPFAVDPASKDCLPTQLISVAHPGERIAWISDFELDPRAADDTEYHMERKSNGARLHSVTNHTPVNGNRTGKRSVCYQIPPDTAPGLFEIRRTVTIYPPNGAAFKREVTSIPVEVGPP